jgi:hypothetical protein
VCVRRTLFHNVLRGENDDLQSLKFGSLIYRHESVNFMNVSWGWQTYRGDNFSSPLSLVLSEILNIQSHRKPKYSWIERNVTGVRYVIRLFMIHTPSAHFKKGDPFISRCCIVQNYRPRSALSFLAFSSFG